MMKTHDTKERAEHVRSMATKSLYCWGEIADTSIV